MPSLLKGILIVAIGVGITLPVSAKMSSELKNEVQSFCDKIRQCSSSQLEALSTGSDMEKMLDEILDKSCQAMHSDFDAMPPSQQLNQVAVACLQSMNAQTCSDLQKEQETPECLKLTQFVQ